MARLQTAIRALAPLVEQRAALQAELEEMQRATLAGALGLTGSPAPAVAASTSSTLAPAEPMLPPRAPHAASRSSGGGSYDGPLGRGAAAGLGGGVGGGARLEPQAPLPSDPNAAALAAALGDADAIAAIAQQRGALTAEVEALRAQVAEVAALREEREALRQVEAEVVALSNEIPHLAPYLELLPTLRAEHVRLKEALAEAERLQSDNESLSLQLNVMRAMREAAAAGGGARAGTAGGAAVASAASTRTPGLGEEDPDAEERGAEWLQRQAAPAGPVEAEGQAAAAAISNGGADKDDEPRTPASQTKAGTGPLAVDAAGGDAEAAATLHVESQLRSVFGKMRELEHSKQGLEEENEELRGTIDDLRQQLEASAEAMQKLRGVAEALSMLRRGGAGAGAGGAY